MNNATHSRTFDLSTALPDIALEEMMVPSASAGIDLYVRNKRLTTFNAFHSDRTVLFVHGATYPASAAFDLALDGWSWMDYIACHGYDVYLLDLRGYGRSSRPKEMEEDPYGNPPIVAGDIAIEDISIAIEFIRERRNISKIALIGWSWGATLIGSYAIRHPQKVGRLIQYGPPWVCSTRMTPPVRIAAYRTLSREQIDMTLRESIPSDRLPDLMPRPWFEAWMAAIWASDPVGASQSPPAIRAPNGVLQDIYRFHGAGLPYYDPAKITVPILLVVGEWDRDTPPYMARTQFPLLVNAPDKRLIEISGATHHIMLETNRTQLFTAVQAFLDQPNGPDSPPLCCVAHPRHS
jgi:pimeloyl-ACP methyl ester carboxylesterase